MDCGFFGLRPLWTPQVCGYTAALGKSALRPNRSATFLENGAIAQLGERFNGIEEVVGSIPSGSTNIQMTSSSSSAFERKVVGEAHRLQGPDLRLLRHADRLGIGDGRGAQASDEQSVAEADARRNSRSARAPRILAAGPDAGQSSIAICWRPFIAAWPRNGASRSTGAIASTYGRSVRNWPAFADTVASLQYLKRHYKLAILSNVDNESFSFSNEKLGVDFDAVYTAEDCGSYKPAARNFEYMLAKLKTVGIEKNRNPAHRREPLPRPWAGERAGACLMLDLSPPRSGGLRRDHGSRPDAPLRLPL